MARGIDEEPYLEWLDGVEYERVSPGTPHELVRTRLLVIMDSLGGALGQALPELHVRIDDRDEHRTILVPDVAFYMRDRLLTLPLSDRILPNVPPDIAVEIRPPNDRPGFREAKIARYLAWGVPLVLDIDPAKRTIITHDAEGTTGYLRTGRFERASAPWLIFDLEQAFGDLDRLGFP